MQTMACLPLTSKSVRWCLAALAVGWGVAAAPTAVPAQGYGGGMTADDLKKKKDAELDGTVAANTGRTITLNTAANAQYLIGFAGEPSISRISVTGTADPSILGPGVFIRIDGVLEEKDGKTYAFKDPVANAVMYTHDSRLVPEDPVVGEESTVQGKILRVKEGVFEMQLFGKKIKKVSGVFTGTPEIKLALTDLTYVKAGDGVKGKGKVLDDKQPNVILGTDLSIMVAEPIKGKRKWVPAANAPTAAPKDDKDKKDDKKPEEKKAD